jgi:hypothetical protein
MSSQETSLSVRLRAFVERWWEELVVTIPSPMDLKGAAALRLFTRGRWFCNLTGELVPELQACNNVTVDGGAAKEKKEECGDDRLSKQLYNRGFNSARVFPCGHAFIDVYLVSAIFEMVNSSFSHMHQLRARGSGAIDAHVREQLDSLLRECTHCKHNNRPIRFFGDPEALPWAWPEHLKLYTLATNLETGSVITNPLVIQERHLDVVAREVEPGQVVTISGYRGMGLMIYKGDGEWIDVPREEYYPIWPLEYLKLRGYLYYLNNPIVGRFDGLPFENDVMLVSTGSTHTFVNAKAPIGRNIGLVSSVEAVVDEKPQLSVTDSSGKSWTMRDKSAAGVWTLSGSLESAEQANALLYCGTPVEVALPKDEHLTLCADGKPGRLRFADGKGGMWPDRASPKDAKQE